MLTAWMCTKKEEGSQRHLKFSCDCSKLAVSPDTAQLSTSNSSAAIRKPWGRLAVRACRSVQRARTAASFL